MTITWAYKTKIRLIQKKTNSQTTEIPDRVVTIVNFEEIRRK